MSMDEILSTYEVAQAWDEMFFDDGSSRPLYDRVVETLRPLSPSDLHFRADQLARTFTERGVTFAFGGEERPFPLDLIPRIIEAEEWRLLAGGVRQRVRALEAFLADAYSDGVVFQEGIVPKRLITSSTEFNRAAHGIRSPNDVRIQVAGIDIVRDEKGALRRPGGQRPDPLGRQLRHGEPTGHDEDLPQPLRRGQDPSRRPLPPASAGRARAAAPLGVVDPVVVVLTPGIHNAAYFEHAMLARRMGVELVEGRDLFCRGNQLWMRTTHGETPVHVVYRRVDDEFLDPLHGRPGSLIGVAGLLNAARAGVDDLERGGQRRGGRQADLHLRAGPHPLLPRRGADDRQRRDLSTR